MFIKFNRIIIIIFILISISANITCKNERATKQHNKESKHIGITLIDKTIIRVDPFIYSSVIAYINKGEIVAIIDKSLEKEKIGNNENYWYNVRFSRGFLGWIYGNNIKIFPVNKAREIEKYLSEFWDKELTSFKKKISGKWGSIVKEGDMEQSLEILDNGKYKSYRAGSNVIEGEYTVNFKGGEIVFSNGTYFGKNITFLANGNRYILGKGTKDNEIKFKKISSKINNVDDDVKKNKRSGA